jgi:tetratricopeptide (TPR) repeat protein
MSDKKLGGSAGHLALVVSGRRWLRSAWASLARDDDREGRDRCDRLDRMRYHLARGRRARDAGLYEAGAVEARKALDENPRNPWAMALLGQCLFRQGWPDLGGARQALERARVLDPTNGYFVGLLLEVLDAQGDSKSREEVLAWAWWSGAPVERWLPDGPPRRRPARSTAPAHDEDLAEPGRLSSSPPVRSPERPAEPSPGRTAALGARHAVHA